MRRIAVAGNKNLTRSTVVKNVEKYTGDIEGPFTILVPLAEEQSQSALWVGEWAQVKDHPYNVYIATETLNERQDSLVQSSLREHRSTNADKSVVAALTRGDTLLIAWDDSEDCERLVLFAISRGAKVYDLSDMTELCDDQPTDGASDPDDDEDEEDDYGTGGEFPTVYVEGEMQGQMYDGLQNLQKAINQILDDASGEIAGLIHSHMDQIADRLTKSLTRQKNAKPITS